MEIIPSVYSCDDDEGDKFFGLMRIFLLPSFAVKVRLGQVNFTPTCHVFLATPSNRLSL